MRGARARPPVVYLLCIMHAFFYRCMAYANLKILSVSLCYSKKRLSLRIIESEYHSKTFTIIVVSITINNIINSSSSLSNFVKASLTYWQ